MRWLAIPVSNLTLTYPWPLLTCMANSWTIHQNETNGTVIKETVSRLDWSSMAQRRKSRPLKVTYQQIPETKESLERVDRVYNLIFERVREKLVQAKQLRPPDRLIEDERA